MWDVCLGNRGIKIRNDEQSLASLWVGAVPLRLRWMDETVMLMWTYYSYNDRILFSCEACQRWWSKLPQSILCFRAYPTPTISEPSSRTGIFQASAACHPSLSSKPTQPTRRKYEARANAHTDLHKKIQMSHTKIREQKHSLHCHCQ